MTTIEITDESADTLFKDILIKDYKSLWWDIKEAERKIANGEVLKSYQREDLEDWQNYINAFDVILRYYLIHSEYTNLKSTLESIA